MTTGAAAAADDSGAARPDSSAGAAGESEAGAGQRPEGGLFLAGLPVRGGHASLALDCRELLAWARRAGQVGPTRFTMVVHSQQCQSNNRCALAAASSSALAVQFEGCQLSVRSRRSTSYAMT